MDSSSAAEDKSRIPWTDFVRFVRQLSHDLRNQLNAAELQAALIDEVSKESELKPELQRLRQLVSQLGVTLQGLSSAVADPRPTPLEYDANDFLADLQTKVERLYPTEAQHLRWERSAENPKLNIDPSLIEWVALELLANAFYHERAAGEIQIVSSVQNGRFYLEFREPKEKTLRPDNWLQPIATASHGHYGLGLRRARAILQAHGGELAARFEDSSLISKITLPRANGAS